MRFLEVSASDYPFSTWTFPPFWCAMLALHPAMGLGRDLVSNLLADFVDSGVLPGDSLDEQLRRFSLEMRADFKANKTLSISVQEQALL